MTTMPGSPGKTKEKMTRINSGISPAELLNKHLLAEHREMKRIPNMVSAGRVNLKNIPPTFRLGTGHVSFFYDKLGYLLARYQEVHAECISRGLNVQDYSGAWHNVPMRLMGTWDDSGAREILTERLIEKDDYYRDKL